jgi:predicted ATPase
MRSRSSLKVAGRIRRKRHTDVFRIKSGALGPVSRCELQIRPLTVFIGRQGTGKSLVAQVLYFFEELPYLLAFAEGSQRQAGQWDAQRIARWILDQLRSHQRAFAVFANPNVSIEWERSAPYGVERGRTPSKLALRAHKNTRSIAFPQVTRNFIDMQRGAGSRRSSSRPSRRALFLPTERMVISQLRTALSEKILSLPLTYTLFADWLESASAVASEWPKGQPDSKVARRIGQIGQEALGGRAERWGEQWKWRFSAGRQSSQFDIDMASSGQRANWSLPYIAQTLFDLRESGEVAQSVTLFVEEPEIHLHPSAQVEMVRILALLVREGFRVVLTTHSLNVIYALNNFMQASRLGDTVEEGVPEPEVRLKPQDVSVYAFTGGAPRQLVDVEAAFIDERELGWVSEDLAAGLNRIGALTLQQEEP